MDSREIERQFSEQADHDSIRLTVHGHREMAADDFSFEDLRAALRGCVLLENYPDHQRGACCLVCGKTSTGRPMHVVCTTSLDVIVVITVYEPRLPKWITPYQRGV